ncbi:MAG: alkaline phosphatase family protein [Candidatus Poseidoniaceae archaeon]|nr:alkaline phosphatase family protein [Candidatus Poseidoniaceae archaeon]MBL6889302.1 alkaline phosphatase family protein [Candidatus Poseidoniaceae archaeon]
MKKRIPLSIGLVLVLCLPSLLYTGSYIVSDTPVPMEGVEPSPYPDEPLTEGFLFLIFDGGRKDMMSDPELMPNLNRRVQDGAYLEVRTNPLTMTAMCVKEMATGVPSRPNEALQNFHPQHPGSIDGFNLASTHDGNGDGEPDNYVGIIGDYVWKDLLPDKEKVPFSQARYGHADYHKGDKEGFATLKQWVAGAVPQGHEQPRNLIIAHLSGLDSVGHRYGTVDSDEYKDKLRFIDDNLEEVFELLPDDWTVVVTSDHGLTDSGQHGSDLDILRDVAAFMWGPNVKQGVVVEGVNQRDLATFPSMLLSLPLPHAVHGRIPLDAFDLTPEKREAIDQWNWNATVARNDWLKEEGHTYVEGLERSTIEWERLNVDEIGIRTTDIVLSLITIIALTAVLFNILNKRGFSTAFRASTCIGFFSVFVGSLVLSYNRDVAAWLYYPMGLVLPVSVFIIGFVMLKTERWQNYNFQNKHMAALALLLITTVMYPETRLSIIGLMIFAYAIIERYYLRNCEKHMPNTVFIPFSIICIIAFFLSDYRLLGVSLTRDYIVTIQQEELSMLFASVVLASSASLLYLWHVESIRSKTTLLTVCALFGLLPYAMWFKDNTIDWVVLSIFILCIITAIVEGLRRNKRSSIAPIRFVGFAWVTISWGAYAGATTMVLYTGFFYLMQREFGFLKIRQDKPLLESTRHVLLALIPIGAWFTWWATMGQLDGLSHPRDIDPGNLFLTGGYIGDRISPSNSWVGFMGGGPMILMTVLWFQMFKEIKWPLTYALTLFSLRVALLAVHLSVTPNLPRLVFKVSWDIVLYFGLGALILSLLGIDKFNERKALDEPETLSSS